VISFSSFTFRDRLRLSKTAVISDDVSGVVSCPKCGGACGLRLGEGNWLTDSMWCVYCGWRPGSRLGEAP
jgi:hypothetical protein